MAKRKNVIEPEETHQRGCATCSEWKNEDQQEFPCCLAKVVVERARPRTNCSHWRSA
ncbi:MAG: hypothetical protein WC485_01900 [Opitutaceae bacterium]